jgi:hypothetical protein
MPTGNIQILNPADFDPVPMTMPAHSGRFAAAPAAPRRRSGEAN